MPARPSAVPGYRFERSGTKVLVRVTSGKVRESLGCFDTMREAERAATEDKRKRDDSHLP